MMMGEEALDLVEPARVGRDEVHVPTRPLGQPGTHLRMLVAGVVVAMQCTASSGATALSIERKKATNP
jgi:hypothetical protein